MSTQQISFEEISPVPAGMVRLAEYGAVPRHYMREREVITSAPGSMSGFPDVTLAYETRGYTCAGSMLRWQEAHWSVTFFCRFSNATHGRNFSDTGEGETLARELFAKWTDPASVTQARAEAEQSRIACEAIQAERNAERAVYAAKERARKAALRKARSAARNASKGT